jgi:hypothetical protein
MSCATRRLSDNTTRSMPAALVRQSPPFPILALYIVALSPPILRPRHITPFSFVFPNRIKTKSAQSLFWASLMRLGPGSLRLRSSRCVVAALPLYVMCVCACWWKRRSGAGVKRELLCCAVQRRWRNGLRHYCRAILLARAISLSVTLRGRRATLQAPLVRQR